MKEKIDVETFIEELQCGDSNTRRRFFAFLKMSKFPQSVKVFFEAESDEDLIGITTQMTSYPCYVRDKFMLAISRLLPGFMVNYFLVLLQ